MSDMARYIDADLEVSKYVTVWDCDCSEFGKQTVMAVDDLNYLPTADVAPRAEWISVEERLPELYTSVLVYKISLNKMVNYMTIDHIAEDGDGELVWNGDKSWKYVITHWMPLPEPPVEE
jgi:hypothetical protein